MFWKSKHGVNFVSVEKLRINVFDDCIIGFPKHKILLVGIQRPPSYPIPSLWARLYINLIIMTRYDILGKGNIPLLGNIFCVYYLYTSSPENLSIVPLKYISDFLFMDIIKWVWIFFVQSSRRSDFIQMTNNAGFLWYCEFLYIHHPSYCASKVKNFIICNVAFEELRRNIIYSILYFKNVDLFFIRKYI